MYDAKRVRLVPKTGLRFVRFERGHLLRSGIRPVTACVVTLGILTGAPRAQDMTLENIAKVWQEREARFRTVRCEWVESIVATPNALTRNNIPSTDNSESLLPERGIDILWLGAGPSMRHEFRPPSGSESDQGSFTVRKGSYTSTYNGVRNKQYTTSTGADSWPSGIVWGDTKYDDISNYHFRALLLTYRPMHPVVPNLDLSRFRVVATDAQVAGRACLVVESIPASAGGMTNTYWIDTARDCHILQHVEKFRGQPTAQLTISYKEDVKHGWVPDTWDALFLTNSSRPSMSTQARVLKCEFNEALSPTVFDLEFPVGTLVFDRDLNQRSLIREDGTLRLITPEESAKGFKYADLFTTEPGELARPQSPGVPSMKRIAFIAVNLLIIIIVVILLWRSRRKGGAATQ